MKNVELKTERFNFTPTLKSTDDSITTDEDVPYTLTINDFGNISESTKEFKITELPTNGKLTLSVTTVETIVDEESNQTTVTQDSKVPVTKDQIVTLGQVDAGKVEFVSNKDSDEDGQFKFQVGDGEKFSKAEYETKIIVNAVAESTTDVATESTTDEQTNESVMNASETRVSNLEDEGVPTSGLDSNSPSSVMMSNSEDSFEDIDLDLELASSKEPESLSSDLLSSNSELNLSDMVGDESDNIDLSNVVSSKPKEESEESSSNNSASNDKPESKEESPFDILNNNQQHQEIASSLNVAIEPDTI